MQTVVETPILVDNGHDMSKFGDELVQSAKQALDFANGDAEGAAFRVTAPAAVDVKAIRGKLKLTRAEFPRRFGQRAKGEPA